MKFFYLPYMCALSVLGNVWLPELTKTGSWWILLCRSTGWCWTGSGVSPRAPWSPPPTGQPAHQSVMQVSLPFVEETEHQKNTLLAEIPASRPNNWSFFADLYTMHLDPVPAFLENLRSRSGSWGWECHIQYFAFILLDFSYTYMARKFVFTCEEKKLYTYEREDNFWGCLIELVYKTKGQF